MSTGADWASRLTKAGLPRRPRLRHTLNRVPAGGYPAAVPSEGPPRGAGGQDLTGPIKRNPVDPHASYRLTAALHHGDEPRAAVGTLDELLMAADPTINGYG